MSQTPNPSGIIGSVTTDITDVNKQNKQGEGENQNTDIDLERLIEEKANERINNFFPEIERKAKKLGIKVDIKKTDDIVELFKKVKDIEDRDTSGRYDNMPQSEREKKILEDNLKKEKENTIALETRIKELEISFDSKNKETDEVKSENLQIKLNLKLLELIDQSNIITSRKKDALTLIKTNYKVGLVGKDNDNIEVKGFQDLTVWLSDVKAKFDYLFSDYGQNKSINRPNFSQGVNARSFNTDELKEAKKANLAAFNEAYLPPLVKITK